MNRSDISRAGMCRTAARWAAFASVVALAFAGGAFAQPSGGPDAKGNAPLKAPHTINDGAAKHGANSFTETQARKHILNAGYSAISGLTKGDDGVWRGVATKDGQSRSVALDFKGNVSEGAPPGTVPKDVPSGAIKGAGGAAPAPRTTTTTKTSAGGAPSGAASSGAGGGSDMGATQTASTAPHHARHHRHHHHGSRCANPSPNGAACSGVDNNQNGISDKEDRAISKGAHP